MGIHLKTLSDRIIPWRKSRPGIGQFSFLGISESSALFGLLARVSAGSRLPAFNHWNKLTPVVCDTRCLSRGEFALRSRLRSGDAISVASTQSRNTGQLFLGFLWRQFQNLALLKPGKPNSAPTANQVIGTKEVALEVHGVPAPFVFRQVLAEPHIRS